MQPQSKSVEAHPIRTLVVSRVLMGTLSVFLISMIVYAATLVLPGDAATAILGQQATPERLAALRGQLHLDQSPISGYLSWLTSVLQGDFGTSLTQNLPVNQVLDHPSHPYAQQLLPDLPEAEAQYRPPVKDAAALIF